MRSPLVMVAIAGCVGVGSVATPSAVVIDPDPPQDPIHVAPVNPDDSNECTALDGSPRRCPPVVMTFGLSTHHFDLSHRDVSGADASGQPQTESAAPLGSARVETFDTSMGLYLGPVYLGTEFQVGGGSVAHEMYAANVASRGSATDGTFGVVGGGAFVGAGLVVGDTLLQLGWLAAQVEVYAGGAMLFLSPDPASQHNYPCDSDGCQTPGIATWVVEPRLRLHVWASRHVSVDGWGGYGVGPSSGDWSAGLAVTLHARHFDGVP